MQQNGTVSDIVDNKLKVATFNVNSIRARLAIVLDWLRKESPDVLCLQETKVTDPDFPRAVFAEAGYQAAFRGEKGYNGVAILSRTAMDDVRIGFDDLESGGSRLITATCGGIVIMNTYVPQGFHPLSEQFREKLDWLQRLYDYLRGRFRPDDPLLWAGDFNIAPASEDVYDPNHLYGQVGYHPDEHAVLAILRRWGLTDLFRLHHPEAGQFTFWDYRMKKALDKNMGWRIDHIWATHPLALRCTAAWIDVSPRRLERPSDHTPVVAEFST